MNNLIKEKSKKPLKPKSLKKFNDLSNALKKNLQRRKEVAKEKIKEKTEHHQ